MQFDIVAHCSTTKARASIMTLPHSKVLTPVFMPVGTSGAMKGVSPNELEQLDCRIILANTYHLSLQPGQEVMNAFGGVHHYMKWNRSLLTDSGGFQMVSLVELSKVTEEGVNFKSPYDGQEMLLTPEKSIDLQNSIGADIIMQLDDVVSSTISGPRVEEAMWRSIRWLDRCIAAHKYPEKQCLFPIVQGGLNPELRKICANEMIKRDCPGYAVGKHFQLIHIGGLSGGESKDEFWRMVTLCTDILPKNKPRYCMGVGYSEDLVVCAALGVDMFDCVFPTRTARFGNALTRHGPLNLKKQKYLTDHTPIDKDCPCPTCQHHSRSLICKMMENRDVQAAQLLSVHNIAYQLKLMTDIRQSIIQDSFPQFVKEFMFKFFYERIENSLEDKQQEGYPEWIVNALSSVGILLQDIEE